MTTLTQDHTALSTLRMLGERLVHAVARVLAAADHALADALDRSRRSEHERFLARAGDAFQLERLEREWERRHTDTWRVR